VKVHVGSILHEYTGGRATVEAEGGTLRALLDDLDRRYPGLRFRVVDEQDTIRPHINMSVRGEWTRDLSERVRPGDEVHILAALSGG
jgi:molybdopterin converting factor small subunit